MPKARGSKGVWKNWRGLADSYQDDVGLEHLIGKEVAGSVPLYCGKKEA